MKKLSFVIIGIIVGVIASFFWMSHREVSLVSSIIGPIQYTCELSGGSFENGGCLCPIEEQLGQTQEMMYDESTGFCQTTYGGSGGDAFAAGSGLPWGHYSYYHDIINYWCYESNGSKSGAACICPEGTIYNKTTGQCGIPDGYVVAEVDGIRFLYPDDLVFVENGFWTRELYEQIGTGQSDVMPFIRIEIVPQNNLTLEQVAIDDHQFGDSKSLSELGVFQSTPESFGYGYKSIGGRNVLWVHAHEKFDRTSYYFTEGANVIIFTVLFSDQENLHILELMVQSS